MSYIDLGREEGAELLTGGNSYGDQGHFVQPTIFFQCKWRYEDC